MAFSDIAAHCAPSAGQRVFCKTPGAPAPWAAIPDSIGHCRAMEVIVASIKCGIVKTGGLPAISRACCVTQCDPQHQIELLHNND